MCACDEQPGGTCSRCRGVTMDDDQHAEFDLEPEGTSEQALRQAERTAIEQKGIR